ncbi:tRNA (mnm(5)s(2)U34)-methyltransferase [Blautia sp. MSJ-19]|uniref:tRNA (mnm(5)s(2)U34)-methyltransferase n=1 Tax=Blautia sp. MSJ-19 TaxID=2841517 RepID=UPI001C0EEC32|nr:class I SAM-dependent methyltransferase [Blautia sp. MSJ-19]MBU5482377.1 class I SAM-dependent methyltransferase [Blautia sp. MSJ-19]
MKAVQITQWCARFIREQVQSGDICIDATMGNGNDTLLLSKLCKEKGHVFAFDIQEQALTNTRRKLQEADAPENYTLLLESHTDIDHYVDPGTVSCITFNLGYLPGGDHAKATHADSSIQALEKSLSLLKKGGLISLCIYSGGDSGFEERDAVLAWLKNLDSRQYLVIRSDYYNRPNDPPIPVLIIRQ